MTEIIENLWLGTAVNASDKSWLRSKGISAILNLSREVPMFFPEEVSYRKIDERVNSDEEFIKEFKFMNEFIDKNRKKGAVLVHCMLESTISTAAVIAYFIFKEKMDFVSARNLVRKRKKDARVDERFAKILKEYQIHLVKKRELKKMVLKQHINLRNSVRLLGDEDDKDSYFSLLNTPQRLSKEEVEKIKKHLESKTVYEKGKIFDTDRAGELINLSELGIHQKHVFPKSQFSPDNFSSPEQVPKSAGSLKLDPISSSKKDKPGRKNTIEIKVSTDKGNEKEYLVTSYSSMKNLGDDPSPFKDIRDYITPTRSHKKRKVESIKNLKRDLVNSINGLSEGLRNKYAKLDKVLNNLIRATPNYRRSPKFQKKKKKKKKKRRGINLDSYGYKSSFADSISVLTNIRKTSKNNPNNIYSQRNIYSSRTLGRRERSDIGNVTIWQKMIQKKMQHKASGDSNKKTYRPVKIQEVNNFSEFDKVRKLMRWSAAEEFESPPFKSSIGVRSKEDCIKRSYKSPFANKKHASSLKKSKNYKASKNSEHLRRVLNLDIEETSKDQIEDEVEVKKKGRMEEANHKLLMEQRSNQGSEEQQKGMALFMMTA